MNISKSNLAQLLTKAVSQGREIGINDTLIVRGCPLPGEKQKTVKGVVEQLMSELPKNGKCNNS